MKPLITVGVRNGDPRTYSVRSDVEGEKFLITDLPSLEVAECIISALRYRQRHVLAERKRSRNGKSRLVDGAP